MASPAPAFRLTLGATPIAGERSLWLWSRASTALAAPPVVRVWQHGCPAFTVTLAYSSTLDLYVGRATLDSGQPMVGQARVWARSTAGETADLTSEFRVLWVEASQDRQVVAPDGRARVFFRAGSLERSSAVSILPGAFLGMPAGLVPLSRPYNIGIDPASPELTGHGVLTIYYSPLRLSQVVSGTVGLYRWEPATDTWLPAGGRVRAEFEFVTDSITRLGTYAILGQARVDERRVYLPVILRGSGL